MADVSTKTLSTADLAALEPRILVILETLAEHAIGYFHQEQFHAEAKADGSPVSDADRGIERKARELLAKLTPDFGFLGEETGPSKTPLPLEFSGTQARADGTHDFEKDIASFNEDLLNVDQDTHWIMDPIDGTLSFLARVPTWSTLLALMEKGHPVLGVVLFPALGEVFIASKGNGARHGRIGSPLSTFSPCRVSGKRSLDTAMISTGTPAAFAWRGNEIWLESLMARPGRTAHYTDAFGHTRVLLGGVDAMVDPVACSHDLAALQILFEETPGAFASSLHGHSGGRAYARGSLVTAGSVILGEELLQDYWSCMANMPPPDLPWAHGSSGQGHEPPRYGDSRKSPAWGRAIESAIADFKLRNRDAVVEEVAVVCENAHEYSARLRNGEHNAPPRATGFSNVQVRAVVAGGTGQSVAPLPTSNPVDLVRTALELAWAHAQEQKLPPSTEMLALRPQASGHFGTLPWGARHSSEIFASLVSETAEQQRIRMQGSARGQALVKSLQSVLTGEARHRFQCFADGTRQTVSTAFSIVLSTASSQSIPSPEERREATCREFIPGLLHPDTLLPLVNRSLDQCIADALELLDASYVPEDVSYDFLAVDADLLGLILHEALGHAAEGDAIETGGSGFGHEGRLRHGLEVAKPWMDIVVDGNLENCGFSPVDYEGVPARRKTIVRNGRLVDGIHIRQTAYTQGQVPEGSARAEDATFPSQCRMTSIWIRAQETRPLDLARVPEGPYPPAMLQRALLRDGFLQPGVKVLYLVGWKGGTASCANLEFRADVRKVYLLDGGSEPRLMRSANFTGIATACFQSAVAAYGAHLCRTLGRCGKDGQGVLTSDGGPQILLLARHPNVSVIGTGDSEE